MARFLVTGGAGYVGSHLAALLAAQGAEVVVFDSLRQGHRAAVPAGARLVVADLADADVLDATLADGPYDAVFHFAACRLWAKAWRSPCATCWTTPPWASA